VERRQRRLDNKSEGDPPKDQRRSKTRGREWLSPNELDHVERAGITRVEIYAENAQEESQGTDQGVDEELEGRSVGVTVPPNGDEEIHPNQGQIKKDEEQDEVERQEQAERGTLEEEKCREVLTSPAPQVDGKRH